MSYDDSNYITKPIPLHKLLSIKRINSDINENKRFPIKFISKKAIEESKSLKAISKKVLEIIQKSKIENYKLITEQILKLYNLNEKEVKNIKRRIYDAMNVIKASSANSIINHFLKEKESINQIIVSNIYNEY